MKMFIRRRGHVDYLDGLFKLPLRGRFEASVSSPPCRPGEKTKLEFRRHDGHIWNFKAGRWEAFGNENMFEGWLGWLGNDLVRIARYYRLYWLVGLMAKEGYPR